jgi:hypothetical protein
MTLPDYAWRSLVASTGSMERPVSSRLTSWKEIAQYLQKGVRTVQRWEQFMGLPVRRLNGRKKGTVLAFSDEIDVWMRSYSEDDGKSELELLRKELAEVKNQNRLLRARLERAERAIQFNETVEQ